MHFDWGTFTFKDVLTLGLLVGWGMRIDRRVTRFLIEHEILIGDYCERKSIEIKKFPTRLQVQKWW